MSSELDITPLEAAVVGRITQARADYLRRTGEDLHWSDIGRAVGWSQTGTSHVKTGKRAVRLREIPPLAALLGVRQEWLAFGSGAMRPEATAGGAARAVGREPEQVVSVRPIAARKPQPANRRNAR